MDLASPLTSNTQVEKVHQFLLRSKFQIHFTCHANQGITYILIRYAQTGPVPLPGRKIQAKTG